MRSELRVNDHTRIVKFIQENPIQVLKKLNSRRFIKNKTPPTAKDLLQTALNTKEADQTTKRCIKKSLQVIAPVEKLHKKASPTSRTQINRISKKVKNARNIDQIKKSLKNLQKDTDLEDDYEIGPGIDLALSILNDGKKNIYFARKSPFEELTLDLAKASTIGSITGAAVSANPSARRAGTSRGAVGGGIGGAVAGSVGLIGTTLWRWVFN